MAELNDEVARSMVEAMKVANDSLTDDTERMARFSALAAKAVYLELYNLPEIDLSTAKAQIIAQCTMHTFSAIMAHQLNPQREELVKKLFGG